MRSMKCLTFCFLWIYFSRQVRIEDFPSPFEKSSRWTENLSEVNEKMILDLLPIDLTLQLTEFGLQHFTIFLCHWQTTLNAHMYVLQFMSIMICFVLSNIVCSLQLILFTINYFITYFSKIFHSLIHHVSKYIPLKISFSLQQLLNIGLWLYLNQFTITLLMEIND